MSYQITTTLTIASDPPMVRTVPDFLTSTALHRRLIADTDRAMAAGWQLTHTDLFSRTLILPDGQGQTIATIAMVATRQAPVTGTGRVPSMEDAARYLLHGTPLPA